MKPVVRGKHNVSIKAFGARRLDRHAGAAL
jgi:hypothetical protein